MDRQLALPEHLQRWQFVVTEDVWRLPTFAADPVRALEAAVSAVTRSTTGSATIVLGDASVTAVQLFGKVITIDMA